eukprot:4765695-Pyramimonas_sp.AAC.1
MKANLRCHQTTSSTRAMAIMNKSKKRAKLFASKHSVKIREAPRHPLVEVAAWSRKRERGNPRLRPPTHRVHQRLVQFMTAKCFNASLRPDGGTDRDEPEAPYICIVRESLMWESTAGPDPTTITFLLTAVLPAWRDEDNEGAVSIEKAPQARLATQA